MMASISHCCRKWPSLVRRLLLALAFVFAGVGTGAVHAGAIEPIAAAINAGDDGYVLSAEFRVDLGARLEEAVARGVPLYFNLEFTLERNRWYWLNEHVADVNIHYRLSYNALTRQFRLSFGSLHQSFSSLAEALRVISRVASLPVADKGALKTGEAHAAAVRLSLDRSQLPKPFQVDAIANRDWQVDSKTLRWQYVPTDAAPPAPGRGANNAEFPAK